MNKQINYVSFNFEKECKMLVNATVPYVFMTSIQTTSRFTSNGCSVLTLIYITQD
jgi:hypothetical protein